MGLISDKKMLPLIILFVLWKNSDEDHHLPTDELVTKVLEIYQPKESCSYESNKRLIVSYLRAMLLFFDEMKEYGYMKSNIAVEQESVKGVRGNNREYFIKNRPLKDVEVRILIDAILFSPGMDDDRARSLIDKVILLVSRFFVNVHRYIHIGNIVQKTDNKEVVSTISVMGNAIECGKRVSFDYRGESCERVSPYYLVVYNGRYYCIANAGEENKLRHYRLDRVSNCVAVDESSCDIRMLDEVGSDGRFHLDEYMKKHPRMNRDVVVTVSLIVRDEFLDTVRQEFQVDSEYTGFEARHEVVEEMRERALRVMKVYG